MGIREELPESFAEVACISGATAHRILISHPEYREARGDHHHPFWSKGAKDMLIELRTFEAEILQSDDLVEQFH